MFFHMVQPNSCTSLTVYSETKPVFSPIKKGDHPVKYIGSILPRACVSPLVCGLAGQRSTCFRAGDVETTGDPA